MRRLDDVLQLVVALHMQAKDHMQFIHKLVRAAAQGVDVVDHAINALHQLVDFRFIAEGGDRPDDLLLGF